MIFRPGVQTGDEVKELYNYAKEHKFAIPAVNVIGTNSINATLETAKEVQSPVIIQLSNAGAHFVSGKGLSNQNQESAVAGAVSAAYHVRQVAELYGIPVVLHTDHADRNLLPWVEALLEANRRYREQTGSPLFSSHMLDLSAEPVKKNIATCCEFLKSMRELDLGLEIELGVTGGVEDGFDHTDIDEANLYTQPSDVAYAYGQLSNISTNFTIAAAFGNVHGVYNPGNVKLKPEILHKTQDFIQYQFNTISKPVNFVFHGGSGCKREEIHQAISYGIVKININTDLQWAFWEGIKNYYRHNKVYLQSQTGNPKGKDMPNKSYYNPQVWLRKGEKSFIKRLMESFEDFNCIKRNV